MSFYWNVLKRAALGFQDDNAYRLAAALSFYAAFSMAPLLVLSVSVTNAFVGQKAVEGHLETELEGLMGQESAQALQAAIAAANSEQGSGLISSITSILVLMFAATGMFVELQDAMNTIWRTSKPENSSLWTIVRIRLVSFMMIGTVAILVLASIVLTVVATNISQWSHLPILTNFPTDFAVSSCLMILLFMIIFRYLPDTEVLWRDVWVGAATTGLLFVAGKQLLGRYLATTAASSLYGAAGSIFIFLLWMYYSSLMFFFGVELTKSHADTRSR